MIKLRIQTELERVKAEVQEERPQDMEEKQAEVQVNDAQSNGVLEKEAIHHLREEARGGKIPEEEALAEDIEEKEANTRIM